MTVGDRTEALDSIFGNTSGVAAGLQFFIAARSFEGAVRKNREPLAYAILPGSWRAAGW